MNWKKKEKIFTFHLANWSIPFMTDLLQTPLPILQMMMMAVNRESIKKSFLNWRFGYRMERIIMNCCSISMREFVSSYLAFLSFFLFLLVSHISYIFNHDRLIENAAAVCTRLQWFKFVFFCHFQFWLWGMNNNHNLILVNDRME